MKALVTALFLVSLVLVRPAAADPLRWHVTPLGIAGTTSVIVPAEWAGVWQTTDSTYTCAGVFQSVSSSTDTLCTGQSFENSASIVCSGSADGTSFTEHCTETGLAFTDCQYTITIDGHGTRSGDNFSSVLTINVTYSGTGTGCDLIPPTCSQVNAHGTRTGPAPAAYCATPATVESWGNLKAHYR